MYKITLRGPASSVTLSTDDLSLFKQFNVWLSKYNPISSNCIVEGYPISSEHLINACVGAALHIGLSA